jgi:ferredoxin
MVCAVRVLAGENATAPATDEEEAAIAARMPHFRRQPGTRLACRLLVSGDGLVVEKAGVRPPA